MKIIERQRGATIRESESDIQKRIGQILIWKGYLVIRFNSGMMKSAGRHIRFYRILNNNQSSGLPDLAFMKNGSITFVEVKAGKGKSSESQNDFASLANQFGINTITTNSWKSLLDHVNQMR
ncbi:hypothetical protein EG832_02610 [bacterium]|nr:hypothetical protein [bacterium]